MSWSWKIGRPFGIPLYVHWTFLILLGFFLLRDLSRGLELAQALVGVGFVLSLFACVVLHELGHALMARRFGIGTADITLLPIGGVARLERMPERPSQELLVALAGPVVNVVIAAVLYGVGVRAPERMSAEGALTHDHFWGEILVVNIGLVLFNMLPAFPMDGGRVLRALLAMAMPYPRATRLAASVGQLMAILFGFGALHFQNPLLGLIALFVWIGAEAEARQVQERFLLREFHVREAMLTDYRTLNLEDTLGHAADLLLAGSQQDFPVVVDGGHSALLTRTGLLQGLSRGGRELPVSEAPLVDLGRIEIDEPLVPAVTRLREAGESCLLVTQQGAPVGLLTLENVSEMLMVRAALTGTAGA